MKPTAVLVNPSRGPVVDQVALADALRRGVIAAAALDVTDPEPMSPDDPLLALPTCLVVPHIASATHATRGKMAQMAAAYRLGDPRPARKDGPEGLKQETGINLVHVPYKGMGGALNDLVGGQLRGPMPP